MAILLYTNGITEELNPAKYTFTDQELLQIFNDFDEVRSFRLHESPNTWCIWGQNLPIDARPDEYNRLGAFMLDQECYSPILFIHDTEIDPSWVLTDQMIHNDYINFRLDILKFFDDVAADLLDTEQGPEGEREQRMKLIQIGATEDKRIIFELDPNIQPEVFYKHEHFSEFCEKIYEFFKLNFKVSELFTLIEDKNVVIILRCQNVDILLDQIKGYFNKHELYEQSSLIKDTADKWHEFIQAKKISEENVRSEEVEKDKNSDETE